MTNQERKRAQRNAVQAAKAVPTGDRGRAHADALARYLRLQAATKRSASKRGRADEDKR